MARIPQCVSPISLRRIALPTPCLLYRSSQLRLQQQRGACSGRLMCLDRHLVLIGPTRAVALLMPEPVIIEVELKVKGTIESEDKDLSFLAVPLLCDDTYYSRVLNSGSYSSKLSTVEFRLGYIAASVEATMSLRVIQGSWPDGFRGQFAACTTCTHRKDMAVASVGNERIVLHDSRGEVRK